MKLSSHFLIELGYWHLAHVADDPDLENLFIPVEDLAELQQNIKVAHKQNITRDISEAYLTVVFVLLELVGPRVSTSDISLLVDEFLDGSL